MLTIYANSLLYGVSDCALRKLQVLQYDQPMCSAGRPLVTMLLLTPRVCNVRVIFDRVTVLLELFVSSKT